MVSPLRVNVRTIFKTLLSELIFYQRYLTMSLLSVITISVPAIWRAAECASLFFSLLFNTTHSAHMNVRIIFLCSAFVATLPAGHFVFTSCAKLCFHLSIKNLLMTLYWALQCRDNGGLLYHRECVGLYFFKSNSV